MPRYLAALAQGTLTEAVCDQLLRPDGPLWNEGRTIVEQELREPAVHFSILESLASGEKAIGEIASALRTPSNQVARYLSHLGELRLVRRQLPFGAPASSRRGHWLLDDPFLRFWFRFVFPFQTDLEAGLAPGDLYRAEIESELADHVAPVFEAACREHVRTHLGERASRVGRWWGNARHDLRRTGARSSEEIDIVGTARSRVTVVGEARWTSSPMDVSVLRDLHEFKLPALRQDGFRIVDDATVVLCCRSGFTDGLRERAGEDGRLHLVDATEVLDLGT